jgi:hypothetical protein
MIDIEQRSTPKITKYFEQLEKFETFKQTQQVGRSSAYGSLLAIKKELTVIDVPDLLRLITKTE